MISNSAISKVFRQIAYLIEFEAKAKDEDMDNDGNNKTNAFKARAYRRTADIIDNLSSNIEDIYNKEKRHNQNSISRQSHCFKNRRIYHNRENSIF